MKQGSLWIALVVLCALGNAACGGSSHHTIATNNFVFYAQGTDITSSTYSIAGVVQISADGKNTIMGGIQDFNDGNSDSGIGTFAGDTISPTGSSIVFNTDGSGNAIMYLNTGNPALGLTATPGVEEFALSFANPNHAIIAEFDGSATSMGSYDLQTFPSAAFASASFSFTASGVDPSGFPIAEGGVYSLDGSGNITGTADINDAGTYTTFDISGVTLSEASRSTFGRGVVQGSLDGLTTTVNYYVVSSEVIRLIDMDTTSTAVGSAYGQGTAQGTFSNASIGTSVFSVGGDSVLYNVVGQFTTVPTEADAKPKANLRGVHPDGGPATGTFAGIADVNETVDGGPLAPEAAFSGTYFISPSDGRGMFNFTVGPTDDIATFGVYAVDPSLNILDPNTPLAAPLQNGGALLVELDSALIGTGLLLPQTNPTAPVVSGVAADVVFGAQGNATNEAGTEEFELVGALATDGGFFGGEGFIDDPFGILSGTGDGFGDPNTIFTGTFADDGEAIGRYTSGAGGFVANSPLTESTFEFTVTAYDANGSQLFWIEMDNDSTWGGPIQASTYTVPSEEKVPAKPKNK